MNLGQVFQLSPKAIPQHHEGAFFLTQGQIAYILAPNKGLLNIKYIVQACHGFQWVSIQDLNGSMITPDSQMSIHRLPDPNGKKCQYIGYKI